MANLTFDYTYQATDGIRIIKHPRIRIGVDQTGKPRIEMLNPDGKVIYGAAEQPHLKTLSPAN